jgi:hypothetical protein
VNRRNYNESLGGRGEILLDFDIIDKWDYGIRRDE